MRRRCRLDIILPNVGPTSRRTLALGLEPGEGNMNDSPETPGDSQQGKHHEYEDHHFHDEDEIVPADDVPTRRTNPAARRKPLRRPPPTRRSYPDDD
jgi:hypothetical protein